MWMVGTAGDPAQIYVQPSAYTEVDVPGNQAPDPRLERYDGMSPTKRRAATTQEIAAYDDTQLDAAITTVLDTQRLISAVVWAILDTYSAPATPAKYQAARTKIINAYKLTPWK
jgi:hypothetical protein